MENFVKWAAKTCWQNFCNLDDIRIGLMQKHYTGYVLVKNTFVNDRK